MEKLVRDNIPELMRRAGSAVEFRQADSKERLTLLMRKLYEEAAELEQNPCLEECADVFEVLAAIVEELGATPAQLFDAAKDKRGVRGAFHEGYVLKIKE